MERLFGDPADRKSVGTIVCGAYAARYCLPCRQILFTPVESPFSSPAVTPLYFMALRIPGRIQRQIEECCHRMGIPLVETKKANHSLETGDVDFDIKNMRNTMKTVKAYVLRESDLP